MYIEFEPLSKGSSLKGRGGTPLKKKKDRDTGSTQTLKFCVFTL